MAQPIIVDPYRREMRARAAAAPWEFAAQAVTATTQSIEQMLFRYQQVKEEEKTKRLGIMGTMVTRYGFDALGPDFARQWETDTGIKFPRDETGKPKVPTTMEEEIQKQVKPKVLEAIATDPNKAMVFAGLQKPPPSAEEQALMNRELDLKKYAADLDYAASALRARATMASASKDNVPSGWVYNPNKPNGQQFDWVGYEKSSMSMKQLDASEKAVNANLRAMDFQKKDLDIQVLAEQVRTRNADAIPKLVNIRKGYDKLPEEEKLKVDALTKTFADAYGISVPEEKKEFRAWNKKFLGAVVGAGGGFMFAGPKGALIGGSLGFAGGAAADAMGGAPVVGGPTVVTPTMRATGKTPESTQRLSSMTDDDLRQAIGRELSNGKSPIDILEQTGNDMRVMQILSEMGGKK